MEASTGSDEPTRDSPADCIICLKCNEFLGHDQHEACDTSTGTTCCVCLGLWQDDSTAMKEAIHKACQPYGGMEANRFSVEQPPSLTIPGYVALRYYLASQHCNDKPTKVTPLAMYLRSLKNHLKKVALEYVESRQEKTLLQGYPPCVESEEQGYLCVHILITPASGVARPSSFTLKTKKRIRKRFRGNDPTEKQGGDPRQNLERRLQQNGAHELWPCNEVEAAVDRTVPPGMSQAWSDWFQTEAKVPTVAVEYHVAVWRRPFFVRALYTKSKRNVSQTPFYVPSGEKAMTRKGVASVEEEIAPVLAKLACGGISTLNNDPISGDVVFGMVKFHASGREDMDVRMLLPPEPIQGVGGRPFVCQVIDALSMPTMDQLQQVRNVINCTNSQHVDNDLVGRTYGRNPLGVGISDCFSFAPAHSFKNLQAETEEKVKYYGCLCWSEREIPSQTDLATRLGSFPLELKQRTPIRVLHRRSNAFRTRRVLTLSARQIDKHYFRLNLSTEAGTYIKEFVHGDLGRTVPSVSSLLGCKTDILELDCEGIAGV